MFEALQAVGNYQLALWVRQRCLELQRAITFGEPHRDVARSLHEIGAMHWRLGQYDAALEPGDGAGAAAGRGRRRIGSGDAGEYGNCVRSAREAGGGGGLPAARLGH
eukprot:2630545-Amphidinium_carterae.1